ncbi:MAG: hypothetical protein K0Q49_2439 [Haloplasmataceae bacterium]|jgi:hypothetical protein|nr:hypothetical protein [Haloplasmataceae bacterium]
MKWISLLGGFAFLLVIQQYEKIKNLEKRLEELEKNR